MYSCRIDQASPFLDVWSQHSPCHAFNFRLRSNAHAHSHPRGRSRSASTSNSVVDESALDDCLEVESSGLTSGSLPFQLIHHLYCVHYGHRLHPYWEGSKRCRVTQEEH